MAITMQMKWDNVTLEQYETLRGLIKWESDVPQGAIFHVAGHDGNGMRVTDIWDSPEDFNNFVQSRLMPGCAEAQIPGEPVVEIYPTHAIFAPYKDKLN